MSLLGIPGLALFALFVIAIVWYFVRPFKPGLAAPPKSQQEGGWHA